jgi:hypothetical protein
VAAGSESRAGVGEVLAGAGIGLLVGLLIGLSVSEVVGSVIAGLVALLAGFFGLRSNGGGDGGPAVLKPANMARIAAFGFVCAAAVILGLAVRAHNLLGSRPADLRDRWVEAGFDEETARQLTAFQLVGAAPGSMQVSQPPEGSRSLASVLFAGEAQGRCPDLAEGVAPSPAERLNAFALAGGAWQVVAVAVEPFPDSDREAALQRAWQSLCEP